MRTRSDWSMDEWCKYYEALQKKAYMNYQETGEPRYDRAELRYGKIVDAFIGYLENKSEVDSDRLRRKRNADAYAERLAKDTYTRDEVVRMIKEVGSF